jgi:hypothetical protein
LLLQGTSHARCINRENTSLPLSTPTAAYTVLSDGTVLAPGTKLMWMRCLLGQTLSNGVCAGAPSQYRWDDALTAAKALTFAGHNDWRVPNVKELVSILEDRCTAPPLNADLFPIVDGIVLWSATPSPLNMAGGFDEAWVVDNAGFTARWSKYQSMNLLLVRDAP